MRFCLAFMMQDDAHWLKLHLPVFLASVVFDGVVAVDGGSHDDSVAYVESVGGSVYHRVFDWHFGAQANFLIQSCEAEGYDALLRIDPDELMFAEDVRNVRTVLEQHPTRLLGLARRHFVGDRLHVHPDWFPDYQWRAWWLNAGTHYDTDAHVHELPSGNRLELPDVTIYHYGYTIPQSERAYKIAVYDALMKHEPLPSKADYANWTLDIPSIPYTDAQPLDPRSIGIHAPFETISS